MTGTQDSVFELYDLVVRVVGDPDSFVCAHDVGMTIRVEGEQLIFDGSCQFSMYALAALLPILPAKQRITDPADWMTTDAEIACPDPYCDARFAIHRVGKRSFNHDDVTKVPMSEGSKL